MKEKKKDVQVYWPVLKDQYNILDILHDINYNAFN